MIHVGSIVIRVEDLERQATFWRNALNYEHRIDRHDFVLLAPPDGDGPNLSLDTMHSDVQIPPRIHLDLYADDQTFEVNRLIGLGATRVEWDGRPDEADYMILADPEGNRFCVIDAGDRVRSGPADRAE